jgi:hypothetical protein
MDVQHGRTEACMVLADQYAMMWALTAGIDRPTRRDALSDLDYAGCGIKFFATFAVNHERTMIFTSNTIQRLLHLLLVHD